MNSILTRAGRCAGIATVLVVLAAPSPAGQGGPPLDVQGHRGCRGLYPENSLPAFEAALNLGVTTIELDVQVTADRVLVVYHDQRLSGSRCVRDDGTPVPAAPFKDLAWDELADIDCGSKPHTKFPDQQRVPGARIPRLEQVLELARDAAFPVRLSIEIKLQNPDLGYPVDQTAALLVDALLRFGLEQRTIVQSFRPEALLAVRELAPEIERAILVRRRERYERLVEESQATILSPRHDRLRGVDVEEFQRRGIRVIPWTVNKPKSIRRMIDAGVDGIISDYPDRVLEILKRGQVLHSSIKPPDVRM